MEMPALDLDRQGMHSTFFEFVRFGIIGVLNTGIDFGVYWILTRQIPLFSDRPYIYIANAISFVVATIFSFFANKTWTFKARTGNTSAQAIKFFGVTTSGFFLNLGTFYVIHGLFGVFDIYAKIGATAVSTAWNYTMSKTWVFNKK